MSKALVIVESPTKANTIKKFLPKDYEVDSSFGHIRDLPNSAAEIPEELKKEKWANIGINYEKNFEPIYVISDKARKTVSRLKDKLKQADEVILATDEDREGEGISWHLMEVLKPKVPVKRMVFHEITKEAILEALKNFRDVDMNVVHAQEARRFLDRLVGYTLSPLLWRTIAKGLAAGRVQSVAVELLVARERERMRFVSSSYWDIKAQLKSGASVYDAVLSHLNGKRIASGKDFDDQTGKLKGKADAVLLNAETAQKLESGLKTGTWNVAGLESKEETRFPARPFTTSTLQQEANRKLGLSAKETMRVAQGLYEEGYITYMRTDSESLSSQAVSAARAQVQELYGDTYLSPKPRNYSASAKGAQEAHEAIRPAGTQFRTPAETGLSGIAARLYDLIWKRTVATQMAEARMKFTTATIEATSGSDVATFKATGKEILFPGFLRAYVEGSDDPDGDIDDQEKMLPKMAVGDKPACQKLESIGHDTKPPARYTEATLIKHLEKEGVGRPSTYASIIDTILSRDYVRKEGNNLAPTFTAFAVTALLEEHFKEIVDVKFTSQMEVALDEIAEGKKDWKKYLHEYYNGESGLLATVEAKKKQIKPGESRKIHLPNFADGDLELLLGQYGPYIKVGADTEVRNISLPDKMLPGDLTKTTLADLMKPRDAKDEPQPIGNDPVSGEPMFVLNGKFGWYVQLGKGGDNDKPKRASLLKGMNPETLSVETAGQLIQLPKKLGNHPESGKVVTAAVGKFGPYVAHDGVFASVKGNEILSISMERAMELLEEKASGKKSANAVMVDLGTHPKGGTMQVLNGRYGPYLKHGADNIKIPKELDPVQLTPEKAMALIAENEGKPKTAKKPFRRK